MNHRDAIRHTMRALRDPPNAPRERPILFSAPMVRAILHGRKLQTRRIIKPQPESGAHDLNLMKDGGWCERHGDTIRGDTDFRCPYGQPGDRLWLREKFRKVNGGTLYFADDTSVIGPWKPSIFMPRAASRITLEITEVRVERLQSITDEDCFAEGIDPETDETYNAAEHAKIGGSPIRGGSPERCAYAALWERINGPASWDANPWVWVLAFRRVKPDTET